MDLTQDEDNGGHSFVSLAANWLALGTDDGEDDDGDDDDDHAAAADDYDDDDDDNDTFQLRALVTLSIFPPSTQNGK